MTRTVLLLVAAALLAAGKAPLPLLFALPKPSRLTVAAAVA